MQSNETNQPGSRRRKQRGADLIEFTMILLPLLMILFALVDTSYGIFVKATLQAAAHAGLRYGVTITGTQANAAGSNLTTMVKGYVQSQSLGFLSGSNGLNYIHVNFYALVGTPSVVTNVNGTTNENVSPNLMQVSVDQYPLPALVPRLFSWATPADKSATTISAVSVDEIEPSSDVPTPGPTP